MAWAVPASCDGCGASLTGNVPGTNGLAAADGTVRLPKLARVATPHGD